MFFFLVQKEMAPRIEVDSNTSFVFLLNLHVSGHEQFLAFRPVTLLFQLCRLIFELDQLQ